MSEDTIRKVEGERLTRELRIETRAINDEDRTAELAFSSQEPYRRWFGDEILGHGSDEVRLERLNNAAALLVNHDTDDQVGVIESARVDADGMGRATVRFGQSARASEIFQDVKDGIRQLVSVGYRVHSMQLDSKADDVEVYRVTDWEPHEVSIVSVPADATVGVGRSDSDPTPETKQEVPEMDNQNDPVVEPGIDHEAERKAIREEEVRRVRSLESLGDQFGQVAMAREHIEKGSSVDAFIAAAAEANRETRQASLDDIGLTDRETRSFSVCRLLLASAEPHNREAQRAAAFELEASAAAADAHTRSGAEDPRGFVLPMEVMRDSFADGLRHAQERGRVPAQYTSLARTLTAGTATDGAELVATNLLAGNFIDVLRNVSQCMNAGATMLTGLVGNVAIPRKTTGSTGGWIGTEGADGAESEPQFDQVTLSPKNVAAWLEYTRQLLQQSTPDIEALVRMDIAAGLATTMDLACLYGSGSSGQPTGIANTSGINAPTNFAAADPTFAEVVAMESAVATDNALMGSLGYMTDGAMRGAFKTTEKASGTAQFIWEPGNTVNGYSAYITEQVTDGDVFFGNWADLLVGMWGGLDLLTDPYSNSKSGKIRVSAFQTCDVAVRHPVSFAFNNDGS